MHYLMHRLACLLTVTSIAGDACADQNIDDELTKTPWQFGFVGEARALPTGLAFRRGITAGVLRLLPDGQVLFEIPCRDEAIIKLIGDGPVFAGTWTLRRGDELTYTISFRGDQLTESGRVEIDGEELHLIRGNGTVLRAGRFHGNVREPCRYD